MPWTPLHVRLDTLRELKPRVILFYFRCRLPQNARCRALLGSVGYLSVIGSPQACTTYFGGLFWGVESGGQFWKGSMCHYLACTITTRSTFLSPSHPKSLPICNYHFPPQRSSCADGPRPHSWHTCMFAWDCTTTLIVSVRATLLCNRHHYLYTSVWIMVFLLMTHGWEQKTRK